MKYAERGGTTSGVELSNVSQHGLWLLVDEREYYLPFSAFPWFREATIAQLSVIERPQPHHIHWPELDVDLTLDIIERPEDFPLVSRETVTDPVQSVEEERARRSRQVRGDA